MEIRIKRSQVRQTHNEDVIKTRKLPKSLFVENVHIGALSLHRLFCLCDYLEILWQICKKK